MTDNPEVISGVDFHTKRRGSLTITIGLPCSGKSTWGEQVRSRFPDRVRIVNRDDIRAAIGARFEDGDEGVVKQIRDFMIDKLLVLGYDVICTDTNLSPKVRRHLANLAKHRKADVSEVSFMDVPLVTCLARNAERWANGDTKVPDEAIIQMHNEYLLRSVMDGTLSSVKQTEWVERPIGEVGN
jgi:predicted kinase